MEGHDLEKGLMITAKTKKQDSTEFDLTPGLGLGGGACEAFLILPVPEC